MIKKLLLNLYIWPLFAIVTVITMFLVPFLFLGNSLTVRRPVSRVFRLGIRIYGLVLVRWLPFFAPVRLEDNSGGMPKTGIFIANHNSSIDPYCYGVLSGEYAFMASWPFGIPFYSWAMKKAEYLNSAWDWATIRTRAVRLLKNGCSLIIWPEGHRSRNGEMGEFKNGAFRLACETGYPVVPVCITGTETLLPPGKRLLTPSRIRLTVLPPLYPSSELTGRPATKDLRERARESLTKELKRQKNG